MRVRLRDVGIFVEIAIQRIVLTEVVQRDLHTRNTRFVFVLDAVIIAVFPHDVADLHQLHEVVFHLTGRDNTIREVRITRQDTRSRHIR